MLVIVETLGPRAISSRTTGVPLSVPEIRLRPAVLATSPPSGNLGLGRTSPLYLRPATSDASPTADPLERLPTSRTPLQP